MPAARGKSICASCAATQAEREAEQRDQARLEGKCINCYIRDAAEGSSKCAGCLKTTSSGKRRLRRQRIKECVCSSCGGEIEFHREGYKTCGACGAASGSCATSSAPAPQSPGSVFGASPLLT